MFDAETPEPAPLDLDHYQAQVYASMAAVSDALHNLDDFDKDPHLAIEAAAAEIRVALRLTRRTADAELDFALKLRRRLPQVWQLLAAGAIDARRARVITETTNHLSIAAPPKYPASPPSAATTTTSATPPAGLTNPNQTAPTPGPPNSATPTPSAAHPLERPQYQLTVDWSQSRPPNCGHQRRW